MRHRALRGFAALVLLVASSISCGVFVSFDGYDTTPPLTPHTVSGTVDGLEGAEEVTVTISGGANGAVQTLHDGPFSFVAALADGQSYLVEAHSLGHTCSVDGGIGTIAGTDEMRVAIHCPSNDASLVNLSVSAGPLSPTFDAAKDLREGDDAKRVYTAERGAIVPPPTTTVTATVRRAGAQVVVADVRAESGRASAPVRIGPGPTPIAIVVTAPDRTTKRQYTVVVPGGGYLKASNTRPNAQFGFSVALSGNTLAVGSPYESSNATGVNGNQADTSAQNAGAVYVFTRAGTVWSQQAYLKASNTRASTNVGFGLTVALSGDTLAVGTPYESSSATGVNGNQADTSAGFAGAAYVFTRAGTVWSQQAYIKASNTHANFGFGSAVALSGDTLAVGSSGESSGVNNNQADTSAPNAGAAYVFTRTGTTWSQQAYLKASNTRPNGTFGDSVALAANTLAVGSSGESSSASGVNGNQADISAPYAGAAYVFTRAGAVWSQQAYIKASNARPATRFGHSVALSADTLAVGSTGESSPATGVNGNQADVSAPEAGAAYVFTRTGTVWSQQAYVKASNTRPAPFFGHSVALSSDTLAVGSYGESSNATGINGNQADTSTAYAGAAYLFTRTGTVWSQQAYVKASNTRPDAFFGTSVALSADALAVGSHGESSSSTGVNGDQAGGNANNSGAVYVFP